MTHSHLGVFCEKRSVYVLLLKGTSEISPEKFKPVPPANL